jgi:uncharacterized protein YbcI
VIATGVGSDGEGDMRIVRVDFTHLLPAVRAIRSRGGRQEASASVSTLSGDPVSTGVQSSAISNATVRLLSEYTGRGPTKARTYINGDLISVVLQDTLTKGERSLARGGQEDLVIRTRRAHQVTMRADLIASVEEITGRSVLAFLSSNHIDPDYAVESFVMASPLEPAVPEPGADGAGPLLS